MTKSPPLNSNEEYYKWMRDNEFWTNLDYVPQSWQNPESFPVIVLADYSMDYNSRYRVYRTFVYLKDFKDEDILEEEY